MVHCVCTIYLGLEGEVLTTCGQALHPQRQSLNLVPENTPPQKGDGEGDEEREREREREEERRRRKEQEEMKEMEKEWQIARERRERRERRELLELLEQDFLASRLSREQAQQG